MRILNFLPQYMLLAGKRREEKKKSKNRRSNKLLSSSALLFFDIDIPSVGAQECTRLLVSFGSSLFFLRLRCYSVPFTVALYLYRTTPPPPLVLSHPNTNIHHSQKFIKKNAIVRVHPKNCYFFKKIKIKWKKKFC